MQRIYNIIISQYCNVFGTIIRFLFVLFCCYRKIISNMMADIKHRCLSHLKVDDFSITAYSTYSYKTNKNDVIPSKLNFIQQYISALGFNAMGGSSHGGGENYLNTETLRENIRFILAVVPFSVQLHDPLTTLK